MNNLLALRTFENIVDIYRDGDDLPNIPFAEEIISVFSAAALIKNQCPAVFVFLADSELR